MINSHRSRILSPSNFILFIWVLCRHMYEGAYSMEIELQAIVNILTYMLANSAL